MGTLTEPKQQAAVAGDPIDEAEERMTARPPKTRIAASVDLSDNARGWGYGHPVRGDL